MTLVHLISLRARRLCEDGYPSDIFLHSILQSAGPASARACHAPDERLVRAPDPPPWPRPTPLPTPPNPSAARLRRPNNDNTVAQAFPLQSRAREGFAATATACQVSFVPPFPLNFLQPKQVCQNLDTRQSYLGSTVKMLSEYC